MKTDLTLRDDVIHELNWDPSINASNIVVEVSDSVVTLSGYVGSYAEKWRAEHIAKRVKGVRTLALRINVRLSSVSEVSDTDITREVRNALRWSTYQFPESIYTDVSEGVVTLRGEVEWRYLKEAAENTIKHLKGIVGISNLIEVIPKVTVNVVKSQIESALKRQARDNIHEIGIDINGDEVTLRGSVRSWSDRELVKDVLWSVPGVRKVVDFMDITV
jgi:osmotically-inducible protein OsmY